MAPRRRSVEPGDRVVTQLGNEVQIDQVVQVLKKHADAYGRGQPQQMRHHRPLGQVGACVGSRHSGPPVVGEEAVEMVADVQWPAGDPLLQ